MGVDLSGEDDGRTILPDGTTVPFPPDDEDGISTSGEDPIVFTDGLSGTRDDTAERPSRYEKKHVLGQGGNGVVIAATDRKMQRSIALKVSHANQAARSERIRFIREARVTGQLNHPNIMPVYDIGSDPNGHPFFTMKEVSGKSLSQRINEGSAGSVQQRLLVFRQVCNAIDFAHSRGVLHRDIKPANVMMGEFGEVLVVDWGLCKVVGESAEDYRTLTSAVSTDELQTQTGQVAGTPGYMAPEQARGEIENLDNQTDIYALGALLYTLLTDTPPFSGPIAEVLERVIAGEVRPMREVASGPIPRELDAIVCKAMHVDKGGRYGSVKQFSEDVRAFMEDRPVSVMEYSLVQRGVKWAYRNKRAVRPVGFTVGLFLAAMVSGGLVHFNRMAISRDAALNEADRANQAEREALVEAVNGRAALSTSEAMYGHSGAAMAQLRAVRKRMLVLDVDTLRADVGLAVAKSTSIQPLSLRTGDDPLRDIRFSPTGDWFAGLSESGLWMFELGKPEVPVRLELTPSSTRSFGPWEHGKPWLVEAVSDGVNAVHPTTQERRVWRGTFAECDDSHAFFDEGWLVHSCPGQGLSVWRWDRSGQPRLDASSDASAIVQQISRDGSRVYVDRYVESESPHHQRFSVLEEGVPVWNGERGTLNSLSPDGQWILASSTSGFKVIHLDSGREQPISAGRVSAFLWEPDSSGFQALDTTGNLIHHGFDGVEVRQLGRSRLAIYGESMTRVVIDPSHRLIATSTDSGAGIFELIDPNQPIANLGLLTDETSAVSAGLSPDGRTMAIGTEAGRIVLLDADSGVRVREMSSGTEPVRAVSFSPDSTHLLTAHWDGIARLWDVEKGAVVREYAAAVSAGPGQPAKITDVLFLDDKRILITGADGHIGVWSSESVTQLMDFSGVVPYVWDSAYSAAANRVLVSNRLGAESGNQGAILDLETGEVAALIPGKSTAYGVAVSPDGSHFVLTGDSSAAMVLDTDGRIRRRLPISTPPGYAAAWSPDGRIVSVSDFSARYQLWASDSWEMVANFGHGSLLSELAFSPRGRTLNVVTGVGELYVLDLNGPEAWDIAPVK